MDTHDSRPRLRRPRLVALLRALPATLVVCGLTCGAARPAAAVCVGAGAQTPCPQPSRELLSVDNIKEEFNDDDLKVEKVRGKWGAGVLHDKSQSDDSALPVVIAGLQSLSGGGKYKGVWKIKRVQFQNRSSKVVHSVQLRWTVASFDAPEKVLAEGTTPFVGMWVEAESCRTVVVPTIYPARILLTAAKEGELYGRFLITFGMQEARFSDGSFWRRQESAANSMSPVPAQEP